MESREEAIVETFFGGSVDFDFHGDWTLRAHFALMALIVNCGEYKGVTTKIYLNQCRRKGKTKENEMK